jgi:hypothetical protein
MVDSPTARLSGARSLMNFEKVNTNLVSIRADLNRESIERQKHEEKISKLLKKEERSLVSLRAATTNLRKIIGAAAGASALRSFSQGNIGEGVQETGIAVAAFLPEIIGITSNIVVGGLATKGLIGGGTGMAGAPKGKAGLLALPLLALAPLLMGAGKNNQSNAPTSEFRREQEVRRTRKNIISSGDTDRFGAQLDRFERILDGMSGGERRKKNVNQQISDLDIATGDTPDSDGFFEDGRDAEGRDREGKLNIQNQIADFLSVLNPFRSIMDMFKSQEERMQDSKDRNAIFGTIFEGIKKLFRPAEAKAGTLDEFLKDGGVLPDNEVVIDQLEANENVKDVGKKLMNMSNAFKMGDDGSVDFKSILGATKGKEMEDLFTNFLGVVKNEFLPLTEDDKLSSIANSFMSTSFKNAPQITKKSLEDAPEFIQDIFLPVIGDGGLPTFEDIGAIIEDSDSATSEPDVDVEFKGSVDKFVNRLLLNINK